MDVTPILSSIQASAAAMKEAYKISEKWKSLEMKKLLIDSQNELLNAESAALNLKNEINRLTEENMDLKRQLKKSSEIKTASPELKENMYWFGQDGPYCVPCYQKSGGSQRNPLLVSEGARLYKGSRYCSVCNQDFGKPAPMASARTVQMKRRW